MFLDVQNKSRYAVALVVPSSLSLNKAQKMFMIDFYIYEYSYLLYIRPMFSI